MNYNNFQEYCERQVRDGNNYASRFLKTGKSSLKLALEEAKIKCLSKDLIDKVEEKGMLDGSFELTYEGAERIFKRMQDLIQGKGKKFGGNYLDILNRFDPVRDSDLIATGIFCLVPEVREKVSNDLNSIYKVVLNVGTNRKKGYALPERQKRNPVSQKNFFPEYLRDLLSALPKPESNEDSEYQRMLHVLIQKKAERDVFPVFKHGEKEALKTLDELVKEESDENIRTAYKDLADTYRAYLDFEIEGVNPNFLDPETGEGGVLPSLHQRIGIYHLLREKRFGIWDGGGTGKTAIAALAIPSIIKELESEGKEFRKAVIGCPNLAKKAWRKGFLGKKHERYLTDTYNDMLNAFIINGEKKDDEFLESLDEHKVIVVNYEQLTTKINGGEKLFIDFLIEKGLDYVIFDESHNVKALRETTLNGRPSHSAAARMLSLNSEYFAPMSATPISNGLLDFAVQYHMLNPVALPDPEKFMELIHNSPRVLYTFFNEKSVRRTSEDINEDLDWIEEEHEIELDSIQRTIYDHVIEFRPKSWLHQARKALLDPRLVNPEVLKRAGVLGEVSWKNSAKYNHLEKIISADDGPVALGEKFIIFSTMFREGVTEKGHSGLKRRYAELGLSNIYDELELDKTLEMILKESLKRKFGRDYKIGIIDGTLKVEEREIVVDGLKDGLAGIICTTETGGESLDFTGANWAFFVDEDYVPDTEQQALWRLIRKGQKKKVHINHLIAAETLDIQNRDYVDKKRIIAKMAMDSVPPTEEEWNLLGDTEGKRFGDLVKRTVGGISIDVYQANVEDLSDFEIKKRIRGTRRGSSFIPVTYTTTDAQKIAGLIGRDPLGCWKDPEFVELYMKALPSLSPHVVHTAKICDLISRVKLGEIEKFPKTILSDGSGPSLLYNSYQRLEPILKYYEIKIPTITDRDSSQLMLDEGNNPNKILACMTGKDSPFKNNQFDMVDNESVSLLKNADEVHSHLLEANRILKQNGLLELIVKNMKFSDEFYSGIETLGFELISEKNQGFSLSRDAFKRLRKIHGEHFAESYSAKLGDTYFLLARKLNKPAKSDPKNFWFETLGVDEPEETIRDPKESRSIIIPNRRRKRRSKKSNANKNFTPEREIKVDRFGDVISINKFIGGE